MLKKLLSFFLFSILALSCQAEIRIQNNELLAFAGDSVITAGCSKRQYTGFRYLVTETLQKNGIRCKVIVSGRSKESSGALLKRLPQAVIAKKPAWLILSTGFNEALGKNASLADFKKNVTSILDLAKKNNIKVILMTTPAYGENLSAPKNKLLLTYNEFLRQEAGKRALPLADVYKGFETELAKKELANIPQNKLSLYGTSFNGRAHFVMAEAILKAMGFSKEKAALARKEWEEKYPAARIYLNINFSRFKACGKAGARKNMNVKEYVADCVKKVK